MELIDTGNYNVYFNNDCSTALNTFVKNSKFSKIFILVDTNTHRDCLALFLSDFSTTTHIEIIEIENGEKHKTIDTCVGVWNALSELSADRESLMINLGGGVVTDIGGFIASTFQRGIQFINVPTSLLAMVDASVGGKTGVDLGSLKNQVGVINTGAMVLIDTTYLKTLPYNELKSGYVEMLKHGLIQNESYWSTLKDFSNLKKEKLPQLIYDSVLIKQNIVANDPHEIGQRKTLNFGHTLGHSIESLFLKDSTKTTLLHGEAIAVGIILATFLSHKLLNFPLAKLSSIKSTMIDLFGMIDLKSKDYQEIINLLKFDKKNSHGNINFVLLHDIGDTKINCHVDELLILEAFEYYLS